MPPHYNSWCVGLCVCPCHALLSTRYLSNYKSYGFEILTQANMFDRCATLCQFQNRTKLAEYDFAKNGQHSQNLCVCHALLSTRFLSNYNIYGFRILVQGNICVVDVQRCVRF